MGWETDKEIMTEAKAIKLKAHAYIMKFKNLGISWDKSKLAAVAMALELSDQYFRNFSGTDEARKKSVARYEQLIHDINAY
jgi:hypothetical protein